MAKKKSGKKSGVGNFFLGAALGALAGYLTAPKSGKQTRSDITKKTKKTIKKAESAGKKAVKSAGAKGKKVAKKVESSAKKAIKKNK